MPSRDLIVLLAVNKFPNILATNISINLLRNPPFCYVASFFVILLSSFINKPDSSWDVTIFMISFISSLEIIKVVVRKANSKERKTKIHGWPDPKNFLWIAASVADTAAVNPNGIKTLLASGLSTFFNKGNPNFSNGPILVNPSDFPILCNWLCDTFILAEELLEIYAKNFSLH